MPIVQPFTPARPTFNVLNYGADPSGVRDSTAAIQAAVNAASAAGGGTVYFPPGTFKATAIGTGTGACIYALPNIRLKGAGPGITTLSCHGSLSARSDGIALKS